MTGTWWIGRSAMSSLSVKEGQVWVKQGCGGMWGSTYICMDPRWFAM